MLGLHRLRNGTRTGGEAAAGADEHGHIRYAQDGAYDARLRREGIDGDDRVGVAACDGGNVGGEDKGLERPAEDANAAAFIDALGHQQHVVAVLSAEAGDGRGSKIAHKSTFLSSGNR